MKKTELFCQVMLHWDGYIQIHQRTAETDLKIIKKFSEGKNAIQIAMEVPCAEATVYRAVQRVERFLIEVSPDLKVEN